jgi:hypothetical protein
MIDDIRDTLRRIAPELDGLRASPGATPGYDMMSDALIWPDEMPLSWRVPPVPNWYVLRFVFNHRTRLILGPTYSGADDEAAELAWAEALRLFPSWPGFLPERRSPGLRGVYESLSAPARKELEEMEREMGLVTDAPAALADEAPAMHLPRLRFGMRRLMTVAPLVYLAISMAGCAFISNVFGLSGALALSLVLMPPLVVAVRLRRRWPGVRGRELAFLALLLAISCGGVAYVVRDWYETGMDRYHAEDERWAEFERLLRRDPALRDVRINLTDRYHIYWASGTVASEAELDRLKSLASRCGIDRRLDGPYAHSVSLTVGSSNGTRSE